MLALLYSIDKFESFTSEFVILGCRAPRACPSCCTETPEEHRLAPGHCYPCLINSVHAPSSLHLEILLSYSCRTVSPSGARQKSITIHHSLIIVAYTTDRKAQRRCGKAWMGCRTWNSLADRLIAFWKPSLRHSPGCGILEVRDLAFSECALRTFRSFCTGVWSGSAKN